MITTSNDNVIYYISLYCNTRFAIFTSIIEGIISTRHYTIFYNGIVTITFEYEENASI